MNNAIERSELQQLINSGRPHVIIEALPARYFEAEHLPGAVNIPHDEIESQAVKLIPNKDVPVVVYCANTQCNNSRVAGHALRKLGYTNVKEYAEGKLGWKDAGLPLETGAVQNVG